VEVTTQVRVARCASSRRDLVDDVVSAVAVDEQHAGRSLEQCLRRGARTILGEDARDIEAADIVPPGLDGIPLRRSVMPCVVDRILYGSGVVVLLLDVERDVRHA
jgi:hypothetical protein